MLRLAAPHIRLLLRLARGPVTLEQLLAAGGAEREALTRDADLLREIGALERLPSGELGLTPDGAQALCGLHNIHLCDRLFSRAKEGETAA